MNKRLITEVTVNHVISEPGDLTRYDYLVTKLGDEYMFLSYGSTFSFPQRLDKWEVSDIKTIEEVRTFIEETSFRYEYINPYTILECINYINKCES